MDFTAFGWRDGLLLAAAAAGVYLALTLLRLLHLGQRKRRDAAQPESFDTLVAPAEPITEMAPHWTGGEQPFVFPPSAPAPDAPAATVSPAPTFSESLGIATLEHEVRQLRGEVAALREELNDLQASRRVSPQYADAMALARRGFDARGVADHCGISLGEAELVLALARSAGDPAGEDDYVGTEHGTAAGGR